mmetsp:Transcript_23452/g.29399  ORF Transcript_23452/g.29399 Transcript_23452/m.29399 type:complete len:255 (-) Transcript_23452:227-991(-)
MSLSRVKVVALIAQKVAMASMLFHDVFCFNYAKSIHPGLIRPIQLSFHHSQIQHIHTSTSSCLFQGTFLKSKSKNDAEIDYAKFVLNVKSPEDMEKIGSIVAKGASPSDTVTIRGDLGSGKTVFARGFVRELMQDPNLSVTSPSYLLDNSYQMEDTGYIIHHMDLFRLAGVEDLDVLNLPENLVSCINLIEWPERMGELEPTERLEVWLDILEEEERRVSLFAHGVSWSQRVIKIRQDFKINGVPLDDNNKKIF